MRAHIVMFKAVTGNWNNTIVQSFFPFPESRQLNERDQRLARNKYFLKRNHNELSSKAVEYEFLSTRSPWYSLYVVCAQPQDVPAKT